MGRTSSSKAALKAFKDGSASLAELERAHAADPDHEELTFVLATTLVMSEKDVARGIALLEALLAAASPRAKKKMAHVHYALGYAHLRSKGGRSAARAPLEEAALLYRKDKTRLLDCAKCLNRLAEVNLPEDPRQAARLVDEAKELLQKSTLPPTTVHVRNRFVQAQIYRVDGRYESSVTEAGEALALARKLEPKDAVLIAEIEAFVNKRRLSIKLGLAGVALVAAAAGAAAIAM